jgi:hypothetical protein
MFLDNTTRSRFITTETTPDEAQNHRLLADATLCSILHFDPLLAAIHGTMHARIFPIV